MTRGVVPPVYSDFICFAEGPARIGIPAGVSAERGPGMLERIVYVSRAASGLVREDVFEIIRTAHRCNAAAGITGGMVDLDGWFVQVLEGPGGPLGAAFSRIAADPRHHGLDLRIRMAALTRLFPDQPMALRQRPHVSEALLGAFGYDPGFPVAAFPADVMCEFVVEACRGAWRIPGEFPAPAALRRRSRTL